MFRFQSDPTHFDVYPFNIVGTPSFLDFQAMIGVEGDRKKENLNREIEHMINEILIHINK